MDSILDFYEKASLYEKLTKLSYEKKISSKRYFFDFISMEDIEIKNGKIEIEIDKQLELFQLNIQKIKTLQNMKK